MKKRVLVIVLVAFFILGSLPAVTGTAHAGCGTKKVDCRIEGGKKVGDSNFSFCWNWKKGCEPCHGYAHLGKWCNSNFSKCEGKCWGCYRRGDVEENLDVCYDKHGHRHDPK